MWERRKDGRHMAVWVEKKQTVGERWLTGGVAAPSLTSLRPAENSPQSQNLQGDFRQCSLSLSVSLVCSVPYIMNTINLCRAVHVGSSLGESAGGSPCWTEID